MIRFPTLFSLFATALLVSSCQDNGEIKGGIYTGDMVLALSWQPAFCETRSRLRECRSQKKGRFDTTNFSLHGLWPQPGSNVYCGVSNTERDKDKRRKWRDLEGLGLNKEIQQELFRVMPGARSFLHRHEWVKHGTCYADDPNIYYADSLALMQAVNGSDVRALFASSIGQRLQVSEVRRAFDKAFGKGVGNRVKMACRRDGQRQIIVEITLGLSGAIGSGAGKPDIGKLAMASSSTEAGCPSGIVDRVGFQ